jgi:glycosyltransferase involved in cell wall biosynthesis
VPAAGAAPSTRMTALCVSVVLPCFEEAAGLPGLVAAVERSLVAAGAAFEIVIVASAAGTDGTVEVARGIGAGDPAVRVVVQPREDGGYGRALALGIAASRQPWVLLMDADGQFDPGDAGRLLSRAAAADVIVGFRAPRRDPVGRRVAGAIYSRALAAATGVPVRDFDCGFKLLRRDLVRDLVIESRTGVANAEILAGAAGAGARIVEAPVSHAPRTAGRARFQIAFGLPSPREASRMLREALALGLRLHQARTRPRSATPGVCSPSRDRVR